MKTSRKVYSINSVKTNTYHEAHGIKCGTGRVLTNFGIVSYNQLQWNMETEPVYILSMEFVASNTDVHTRRVIRPVDKLEFRENMITKLAKLFAENVVINEGE